MKIKEIINDRLKNMDYEQEEFVKAHPLVSFPTFPISKVFNALIDRKKVKTNIHKEEIR